MKRVRSKTHDARTQPRPRRRIYDDSFDVYGMQGKLPDPTVCPECRALYLDGRWVWREAPAGSAESRCPACRRIADRVPAGLLTLSGAFARSHREEIENLLRHVEEREKVDHPLHRIMEIQDAGGNLVISTTHGNLARSMGHALSHAFHGESQETSTSAEPPVRFLWHRD